MPEGTDDDGLLENTPGYRGQIRATETVPRREAEEVAPSEVLDASLAEAFADAVGGGLYTHQAEALELLEEGENVCVSTSTSSGKTFVYALRIALNHLRDPDSTALTVHPTKALSADQERSLNDLYDDLGLDIRVEVYDGDTRSDIRRSIREDADVIITNFAGVNVYLNDHSLWKPFFEDCRLVAVDESHTYTGVHGMHVAWTVRRLRRVLKSHGSDPQFVCTSATIGNPREHSEALVGDDFVVVNDDGSPRGEREIAFWQPPVDEEELESGDEDMDHRDIRDARASPVREASSLLSHLGKNGLQTLMFTRSRKNAELGARYAEQEATKHPETRYIEIEPYHAGLGKRSRRSVENRLKSEDVDGVTSTNALELGIDIGSVDATVLTGYPGTRQSFWQQIGRSGRGETDSLAVFVARHDGIDSYILDNPGYVLEDAVEDAVVDLRNNPVYAKHVLCAADEIPLTEDDRRWFDGDRLDRAVRMWKDAGKLSGDLTRGVRYTGSPRPQSDVSMYTASDTEFDVRAAGDDGIDMEPVDRERAYRDHHEGALFLHDGVQYEVVEFREDVPNPYIRVREVQVDQYTQTLSEKTVGDLVETDRRELGGGFHVCRGEGTVEIHYHESQRREIGSGDLVSRTPTELPPIELRTGLMWVETPDTLRDEVVEAVRGEAPPEVDEDVEEIFLGSLHGSEHGMIKMAPLELRMDKSDLGGLSIAYHPETEAPTWFVHDVVEGGIGFSERIYENFDRVVERTHDRVSNCDCGLENGCPACIMDSQCGNNNRFLHREATAEVLDRIPLGR